ncbi:hypothetical protein [Sphingobacterium sp. JUb56]|uniref:hypothetical protein n=1 Tax=Sphingobacterium sp. JUb56 TaxID=2587145 RepID=UPI00160F1222|nr:hypothetical protein [Sphingobacterium sp. JUb56]MBB2949584.1 hypothetical protein [Sphingobacterium sp. JUb56]
MKTVYKISSLLNIIAWTLMSLVIIGSAYHDMRHLVLNSSVGIMVLIIPIFTYKKRQNILRLWEYSDKSNSQSWKNFSILNIIQSLFVLLIGSVGLFAVISRAFGENYPVFG